MTQTCPICGDTRRQKTILTRFDEEEFGHNYCAACGASYDSNIVEVRATVPDQDSIEQISNREDYRKLFVETWEIANDDDEVYPDFAWDDNDALQRGVVAPVIESINTHLQDKPGAVLDLGCGNGFTTKLLGETYGAENVIGLDPSPLILRTAARKGVRGLQGTLDSVRFDSDQFDAVAIIGNLMLHPDMAATLAEAHRITRPGGVIVLDFKNVNSFVRRIAKRLALTLPSLGNNGFIQRNFVNMRYGLGRSHISMIAPPEKFDVVEVYSKPPRLLGFANKSDLATGVKGMLWRLLDLPDRMMDERAWVHVTLRVKK